VRPIISPAMNTARMATPACRTGRADAAEHHLAQLHQHQRHGAAQRGEESCMALTAPQDAAVVTVANSAEALMPKRTSLPSMLPPLCSALALRVGAQRAQQRVALLAGPVASTAMTTNIAVIAPSSAQPWRASPPAEDEAQRRRGSRC
jgi:hypothetical protein